MICSATRQLCLLGLMLVTMSLGLSAQTSQSPGLEAFRIFVEEKDVDRVVTPAFLTVRMDELDKLLKDYVQRRSLAEVQDGGIQRATYVARWNEQTLSSRASQFQVTGTRGSNPLNIGRISLALEEPQGVPEQSIPLTRQLRYLDDDRLQILADQQRQDYWFGFKAKTRRRDSGQHSIDLEVPKAVVSMMLLAVPTHTVVTSNLPCAPVTDVSKYLPEGWPPSALPSLAADEQWFAVWLSGNEQCTLRFAPAAKVQGAAYRMLVASAQSDTQVAPAGIQVSSQFRLPSAPPGGKLRLLIEDQLHVRSISVGATKVSGWRTINDEPITDADAATRSRARLIEVPCESSDNGMVVVTVDCIGRLPLPFEGALPRVEIEGAYVLDGRCTLLGNDRIQVEDARSAAHVLATSGQSGVDQWQWQWTGKAPVTSVRLRVVPHQWIVRSLTRFDVQSDVVVASVHANVSTSHIQGNQTKFMLASGWFVDSYALENAPPGVVVNINDTAGDASELVIRWDERRSDLDVRLNLKAHFHQSTEVENLKLTSTRILSLPGADQVDHYFVESSGRFRIELDPELLRLRVREDDLVAWQRSLLPRLAEAWIFNAGRAALPVIRLSRTRATLEAKLHTTIIEDDLNVAANYSVVCKPISGSIKQLKIAMWLPADAVAPTWAIVDPFTASVRSKLTAVSSAIMSSSGETTFTIDLSEDVAEEFQLQTELILARRENESGQSSGPLSVPLPQLRQAVSQEAVLVVPARYNLPSVPSIEILPAGLCCDGGKLVEVSNSPPVVAVRYDASAFAKVDLQPQTAAGKSGWAHSQLHEHWQYRAGRTLHHSTWDVASPTAQKLQLHIPPHWEFQSLSVNQANQSITTVNNDELDGYETSDQAKAGWQTLSVDIPKGNRVRLHMICSSFQSQHWFQPVVYAQPELPLPVLNARSIVWFPDSRWATASWPELAGDWEERFCPQRWWQLLGMQPGKTLHNSPALADSLLQSDDVSPELERASSRIVNRNNWWKLEFQTASPPPIWAIDQSIAGTACLSCFLILCMLFSLVCGSHWWRWWWAWIVVGTGLAVVPTVLLLAVQMLAIALGTSTLARLARAVAQRSRAVAVKRFDSMQLSRSILPRSGVASIWLLFAMSLGCPTALAQPFKSGIKDKREVFGILIPVDDKYKVAGEYVYISPRLYGLLRNADQTDSQTREVRVANAIYSLSISNELLTSTNTVGDLTVELIVQASLADAELRLPFLRSEATLVRASLDSQSLIQGDRIRQDNEAIIWRASDSERHTLRLTLRPRAISQREGRGQLLMSIPAIPTARLEIQSENLSDLREILVDAIGGTQAETFRTLAARLGPLSRLNVSWPLNSTRSGPTQTQSDTWVHSRGEKVMAMCQMRLRGVAGLNGTLAIAGDSNWVPVGQDWNDFRMIATEGVSPAGKPIYNIERLEDRNSDELTLRVLMLPKDETVSSLTIPFLQMQQPIASVTRTFALSHTDTPLWKTVGAEWQPLLASQAAQLWDRTRLAEQPTLWKVPAGTVQATLQRVAPPVAPSVDEVTDIQMQMPETKIKYTARWSTPLIGPPAVRFHIPNVLRLDNVLVDAIKARYSIHRLPGSTTTSELVVFIDSSLGGIQNLNLQFSLPTRLNRAFRLPRPVLLEAELRTSAVQIYRGVELASTHAMLDGNALEIESLDVRDSQLLQDLQSAIGRLELGDRFRESPELPIEFTLTRAATARAGRAVMRFTRNDQGWRGQLDALVEIKPGDVNHVFFEMPRSLEASLKDPLEANVAMNVWPSPDSNRMLLSVLPVRETADQARISFAFKLPSSGVSQTINIPDIRLLGMTSPRPALALPTNLSGESVRWAGVGRPLAAGWLQPLGATAQELAQFDLFEPIGNQSQAVWHPREQREKDAQLLLTCITLCDQQAMAGSSRESGRVLNTHAEICYWLEPHDHAYLDIDIPEDCQLVGLEANDLPGNWLQESAGRVRVLLQPSYMPSRLRLFVRWSDLSSKAARFEVSLPRAIALAGGPVLICQRLNQPSTVPGTMAPWTVDQAQAETSQAIEAMQAQVWADTLTRSAQVASGRGNHELAAWLPSWDPLWLGLDSASLVTVRRQAISSRATAGGDDPSDELQLSVGEFWREFLNQYQLEGYATSGRGRVADHVVDRPVENMRAIGEYAWQKLQIVDGTRPDRLVVGISHSGQEQDIVWRWSLGFSWLILVIAIGSLAGGSLRSVCHAMGELIWPLWLVLALACATLLPVLWPAAVVTLGLIIVLVRRYRELRRDRRFVLMPKR